MRELAAAGPAESITLCDSRHGTGVWPPSAARVQRPERITASDVVVIFKAGPPASPHAAADLTVRSIPEVRVLGPTESPQVCVRGGDPHKKPLRRQRARRAGTPPL